jgi:Sap, sulfolipid-1-addressing protein
MLWEAIPTALVAAFSPWTLLIVAGLLSRDRPVRLALVFLASAAALTFAIGFAVVLALGGAGIDDSRRHRTVPPAIDVVLGLAILGFAAYVARRPPRKAKTRRRETGLLAVIILGFFVGAPSPLYLASLHSIAKGHPDTVTGTLDVLLIVAVVLLMAELPIAVFLIAPERTAAALDSANGWLARHGRIIAVTAAAAAGCYFVISGIVKLA